MKNILCLLLIVGGTMFSCSNDEITYSSNELPQKWVLVQMSGQVPNSVTIGDKMAWQEYYVLKADSSFIKHRERNGVDYEASGVFSVESNPDGTYFKFVYDSDSEIIGNCSPYQTETLVKRDTKLIGTWWACDGPGLEYQRKE